jgi:hypothetical protein
VSASDPAHPDVKSDRRNELKLTVVVDCVAETEEDKDGREEGGSTDQLFVRRGVALVQVRRPCSQSP